jgi:hypothetical protein
MHDGEWLTGSAEVVSLAPRLNSRGEPWVELVLRTQRHDIAAIAFPRVLAQLEQGKVAIGERVDVVGRASQRDAGLVLHVVSWEMSRGRSGRAARQCLPLWKFQTA